MLRLKREGMSEGWDRKGVWYQVRVALRDIALDMNGMIV